MLPNIKKINNPLCLLFSNDEINVICYYFHQKMLMLFIMVLLDTVKPSH